MPHRLGVTSYAKEQVIGLIQEFFSSEKNVGPDLLFNKSKLEDSKTLIADKYTVNLEDVEKRPSVIVMRGQQSWGRRGLDQFLGQEGPNAGKRYTDLIAGTFNCICTSRVGLEAEEVAELVFGFFTYFKEVIRNSVKGIHDIQGVSIGEETIGKSDSDIDVSIVPVSVTLLLQWTWLVEKRGPEFKQVCVFPRTKGPDVITQFINKATPAPAVAG